MKNAAVLEFVLLSPKKSIYITCVTCLFAFGVSEIFNGSET